MVDVFINKEEFNFDRFMLFYSEDVFRFSFILFGGGFRSCVGKEFVKIFFKIFIVELVRYCDWRFLNGFFIMKTSFIVYFVDDFLVRFTRF